MGALYRPKSILSSLTVTENIGVHKPSAHQNIVDGHMDIMSSLPGMLPPHAPCGAGSSSVEMWQNGWMFPCFISNFVLVS